MLARDLVKTMLRSGKPVFGMAGWGDVWYGTAWFGNKTGDNLIDVAGFAIY